MATKDDIMTSKQDQRVFIVELGEMVNRRPATIRAWDRTGMLPEALKPQRSDRGWRYWERDQVAGIKQWMIDQDLRPGKGLGYPRPSEEEINAHMEGQRLPRKNRDVEPAAA